jgi:hypothetical protein
VVRFRFHRPVVLFHSDDWGLAGVPTPEVYALLRSQGMVVEANPWDSYSLEKAEDLSALYGILSRHHDIHGRCPAMVFSFVLANIDFPGMIKNGSDELLLQPLRNGIPDPWDRPGLIKAYREGIRTGFIYPSLHGNTHFNASTVSSILGSGGEYKQLLISLYREGTPQLYSKTPWLGFEYRAANGIFARPWIPLGDQKKIIAQSVDEFEQTFGVQPISTCAPGYRANHDTWRAWAGQGFKVAQEGPGLEAGPYQDHDGLLHLPRTVSLEPALVRDRDCLSKALKQVHIAFDKGWPAVVCMHSINFQSAVVNYRDRSLKLLDQFLIHLEQHHKDLSYLHDGDMVGMVEKHLSSSHGSNPRDPLTHSMGFSPTARRIFQSRVRPEWEGYEAGTFQPETSV